MLGKKLQQIYNRQRLEHFSSNFSILIKRTEDKNSPEKKFSPESK
jgi:hypothetical protein